MFTTQGLGIPKERRNKMATDIVGVEAKEASILVRTEELQKQVEEIRAILDGAFFRSIKPEEGKDKTQEPNVLDEIKDNITNAQNILSYIASDLRNSVINKIM